jgi:hypothetical protein
LDAGLHFLIPFVDRVAYRFSRKEEALVIPNRAAITHDNVRVNVIGVLYFRVIDPQKAAYVALFLSSTTPSTDGRGFLLRLAAMEPETPFLVFLRSHKQLCEAF